MPSSNPNPLLNDRWAAVLAGTLTGFLIADANSIREGIPGTDYLAPNGSGSGLTFNQLQVTDNLGVITSIESTGNVVIGDSVIDRGWTNSLTLNRATITGKSAINFNSEGVNQFFLGQNPLGDGNNNLIISSMGSIVTEISYTTHDLIHYGNLGVGLFSLPIDARVHVLCDAPNNPGVQITLAQNHVAPALLVHDDNNVELASIAASGILSAPVHDTGGQVFNVKSAKYGAVGDGITNDSTAILAAIADAHVVKGAIVEFPVGHYLTTVSLPITTDMTLRGTKGTSLDNDIFGGAGWTATTGNGSVLLSTLTSGAFIDCTATVLTRLCITDLAIVGVGNSSRTTVGIQVGPTGSTIFFSTIESVRVANFKVGIEWNFVENGTMHDVWVFGCETGISLGVNTNANTFTNVSVSQAATGVLLDGANSNVFVGGAIQGVSGTGIILQGSADNNSFIGVYFENSTATWAINDLVGDGLHISSCTFSTDHDNVNIASNGCRIDGVKYGHGVVFAGSGNFLSGSWTSVTDTSTGSIRFYDTGHIKCGGIVVGDGTISPLTITVNNPTQFANRVGQKTVIQDVSGGLETIFASNAYYDGTNWRYIATGTAAAIRLIGGAIDFYTAASGTGGDIILNWDTTCNHGGFDAAGVFRPLGGLFVAQSSFDTTGNLLVRNDRMSLGGPIVGGITAPQCWLQNVNPAEGALYIKAAALQTAALIQLMNSVGALTYQVDGNGIPILPAVAEASIPNGGGPVWSTDNPGRLACRTPAGVLKLLTFDP